MARTLEGEAGLNDPVAVLLVLGLVELILHPDFGALGVIGLFAKELAIGAAVGLALPRLLIPLVRRTGSAPLGIHFLGSLGALTIAYGGAAALGGSGFLAVYLAGLMLGGSDLPQAQPVRVFHQGLAQLAEVALFLTLGLLVFPSQIPESLSRASSSRSSWRLSPARSRRPWRSPSPATALGSEL